MTIQHSRSAAGFWNALRPANLADRTRKVRLNATAVDVTAALLIVSLIGHSFPRSALSDVHCGWGAGLVTSNRHRDEYRTTRLSPYAQG